MGGGLPLEAPRVIASAAQRLPGRGGGRICPRADQGRIFPAEEAMILVRDIFQVKFGRMKEAKDVWKEMLKLMTAQGQSRPRLLTDLVGPYYTLVLESTYKDLADYEAFSRQGMSAPELEHSTESLCRFHPPAGVFTILDQA